MGLDVYLYKYEDLEKYKTLENEYERRSEEVWKKVKNGREYEQLSDEGKEKAGIEAEAIREELDIKRYEGERVEISSSKYPEHYFKIGYFRSSYNEGGFNRVVGDAIGTDLYSIFEAGDEYIFIPNWNESKVRTERMIKEFKEYLKEGAFRVSRVPSHHNKAASTKDALGIFLKELSEHKDCKDEFCNYSCMKGEFFLSGFEIKAVINGNNEVYLIYEDKKMEWHLEALEIVLETINWVLLKNEPEKYALHWSS